MRVGTVTDHFAASKADHEGGDYSPEAEPAGAPMPSPGPREWEYHVLPSQIV